MTRFLLAILLLCSFLDASAQKRRQPPPKRLIFADSLVIEEAKLPNIDSADDRPSFTLDGKQMFFGSRRRSNEPWRVPDANPRWKWDSDLWYRVLSDTGWSIPINLGPLVNNSAGQINPTVHPRGDLVYYVSAGNSIVWQAKLVDGKFQDPKPVGGQIPTVYQRKSYAGALFQDSIRRVVLAEMEPDSDLRVRAPDAWELHYRQNVLKHVVTEGALYFMLGNIRCESTVTPDGKYVIFSENFGVYGKYGLAGVGDDDLWLTYVNGTGGWDSVKMLTTVNSPYRDCYPFIAADGVTLFFTSNRPCLTCPLGTSGGEDIYRTQLMDTGWSKPVPLGPPFNSARDDYGFSIGPDGETAYFVSNRTGKSKLYQVKLRTQDTLIKPKAVIVVGGQVTDKVTKKPLKAEIFIDNLGQNANKFSVWTDSTSGRYALAIQRGDRYGLQAVAEGYLPRSERFEIPLEGAFDLRKLDMELAPIAVGSQAEFKNVYFPFNKANLLKESQLELNRVAKFLKEKGHGVKVEISGHTDDVGTDAANQKLSEARAKSVLEYLVSIGIARDRMTAVGYGKSKPLIDKKDDESRAKNRRVEMTILSKTD